MGASNIPLARLSVDSLYLKAEQNSRGERIIVVIIETTKSGFLHDCNVDSEC